jgi:hypothetical protein
MAVIGDPTDEALIPNGEVMIGIPMGTFGGVMIPIGFPAEGAR